MLKTYINKKFKPLLDLHIFFLKKVLSQSVENSIFTNSILLSYQHNTLNTNIQYTNIIQ